LFHFLFGLSWWVFIQISLSSIFVGAVVFCGFQFAHSCSGNRRIWGFIFQFRWSLPLVDLIACFYQLTSLVSSPSSLIVFVLISFLSLFFFFSVDFDFFCFFEWTPGVIICGSLDVSSSTSSKTGGNSLFIFPDSYCSTPFLTFSWMSRRKG